jgi:hypothetical protein
MLQIHRFNSRPAMVAAVVGAWTDVMRGADGDVPCFALAGGATPE